MATTLTNYNVFAYKLWQYADIMQMHTLILCPLKIEMQLLVEELQRGGYECVHKNELNRAVIFVPQKAWIISVGGHGKVAYALSCVQATSHFKNLKSIWCAGSAGALHKDIDLGHVVLAQQTIEHDFKSSVLKKQPTFMASVSDWDKIKHIASDLEDVSVGIVASGDEDIVTELRASEIFEQTGAWAVAWEGAGGAKACKELGVGFLEIRSITDNANEQTLQDFKLHLKYAMSKLAKVLLAIG